jgi:hypothetical protein
MTLISRAEGGQLQPPIRHAGRRYGRNCPDPRLFPYTTTTLELRPEHGLARLSPYCNLVPGHRRCRYWRLPQFLWLTPMSKLDIRMTGLACVLAA